MDNFKYLFKPIKVGPVTIKNRVLVGAHGTDFAENGLPSETNFYYHVERAKGGVGLIIMGQSWVMPTPYMQAHNEPYEVRAYDPQCIPGFRKIVDGIHAHGAKVFLEYGYPGAILERRGPSVIPDSWAADNRVTSRELEIEEIKEIVRYYGITAKNVTEAGFDGIEIHDHGQLVHQFLSPLFNHRTDEYGGPLENRMRFLFEVIDEIKRNMSGNMALGYRLCTEEFIPGGVNIDMGKEIARKLEATGKIDYIEVDIAIEPQQIYLCIAPMYAQLGQMVYAAAAIREVVKIPVFAGGRIIDPAFAEKILADGKADMVSMVRAHIADPEIVNKAMNGRADDIRTCLGCNERCIGNLFIGEGISCTVNPAVGKERELGIGTLKGAEHKKRVIIVGGGPAGMECARVASLRGHDVTLYESASELGGQVNLASQLPGRSDMAEIIRWLKGQILKSGVKVVTGHEVTPEFVIKNEPDAVVVATGASTMRTGFNTHSFAPIPGWDNDNVLTVEDILEKHAKVGHSVVIIDDVGYDEAVGLAELLATDGRTVTILTRYNFVGQGLVATQQQPYVYNRILKAGVRLIPQTFVKQIIKNNVITYNVFTHEETTMDDIDTVVMCSHKEPNDRLYRELKGKVGELYRIGDCNIPHSIGDAIADGHRVGRLI